MGPTTVGPTTMVATSGAAKVDPTHSTRCAAMGIASTELAIAATVGPTKMVATSGAATVDPTRLARVSAMEITSTALTTAADVPL